MPDSGTEVAAAQSAPRSRIASATGLQMIARIGGVAASLVTVSLTTRELGPDSYGHLQAAIMFVALWTSLTELGVNAVIVRRVTGHDGDLDSKRSMLIDLVRTNLGMSSVFCIPLTGLAMLVGVGIYHGSPETRAMVLIVAANLALTALAISFDPVFMVRVRFGAVAIADFVGRIGSMALTIALVATHAPLFTFAVVQLVPTLIQLAIKAIAASRVIPIRPRYTWAGSLELIRESLPQTVILVIGVLYWRIDGVILSVQSSSEQVGLYGLAYTLAFTASMVPEIFLGATLSTSTELFSRDRAEFVAFTRRTLEVLYLLALPLAVLGSVLAGGIMTLIGSAAFGAGGSVLALLFIAAALTFVNASVSQALFAAHQQVFLMRLNIANLAVNVVVNIAVTPTFGATGAAAALVLSEVIGVVVANFRLAMLGLSVQPVGFVLRCVPALVVSAVTAWLLVDTSVVVAGIVAAGAYLAIHLAVGPGRPRYLRTILAGRL